MSEAKDVTVGSSATSSEGKAARKPSKLKQFLKEAVEQTLQQSSAASAVSANGVSKHDAGSASASMAVDSGPSVVASAAPVADSGEPKRKRQRTRWAPEEPTPSLALASAPASASDGTTASSSDGVAASSSDGAAAQPAQSTALVSLVKRRRWGSETEKAPDSPTHDGLAGETMPTTVMPPDPAAIFAAQQHEVLLLRTQVETLSRVQMQIHNGNLEAYYEGRPRSPSPEPVYDGNGRRINSRTTRLTMKLNKERTELLQRMMRLSANNPLLGGGVAPGVLSLCPCGFFVFRLSFDAHLCIVRCSCASAADQVGGEGVDSCGRAPRLQLQRCDHRSSRHEPKEAGKGHGLQNFCSRRWCTQAHAAFGPDAWRR